MNGLQGALGAPLRKTLFRAAIAATALSVSASAVAGPPQSAARQAEAKLAHWLQVGQASWYGLRWQGHKTASGERFDMNALTCAHRTLPFGSWLKVTNLRNMKTVLVRVTDRGPVNKGRVLDLSFAAAKALDLGGTGTVRVEPSSPPLQVAPSTIDAIVSQLELPAAQPIRH